MLQLITCYVFHNGRGAPLFWAEGERKKGKEKEETEKRGGRDHPWNIEIKIFFFFTMKKKLFFSTSSTVPLTTHKALQVALK